mmetsp:Transcript_8931/g.13416  ORF Transcript_8931/g.13416 Transcript_8931/m.13416 type:complete len:105 (+) Transcript_8931:141-455(+)
MNATRVSGWKECRMEWHGIRVPQARLMKMEWEIGSGSESGSGVQYVFIWWYVWYGSNERSEMIVFWGFPIMFWADGSESVYLGPWAWAWPGQGKLSTGIRPFPS